MSASEATLQSLAQLLDVHLVHLRTRTVPAHSNTDAPTTAATAPPGTKGKKRSRGRAGRASKENAVNNIADGQASEKVTPTSVTDVAATTAAQTTPQTTTASDSQATAAETAPQVASTPSTGGEWIVKDFLLRHAIGERDFIDIRCVWY